MVDNIGVASSHWVEPDDHRLSSNKRNLKVIFCSNTYETEFK
jgi:hypothetical protein